MKQYIVIAEIYSRGFIAKITDSFDEAQSVLIELNSLSENLSYGEMENIAQILEQRKYHSYKVNGTEVYYGKIKSGNSNGAYSVSIAEIDTNNFSIQRLIRERGNISVVFHHNDISDELLEKFPYLDIIAN